MQCNGFKKRVLCGVCLLGLLGGTGFLWSKAHAAEPAETETTQDSADEAKGLTGLPLPRFASLRFAEINLRTGPGTRYPIDWVYVRQGLPVEITAEFDVWRRIRDWEGTEGWVQKAALSGKRTVIVTQGTRDLHQDETLESPIVAHVAIGATGQVVSCAKDWCKLKFGSIKGYLPKAHFWGTYPEEEF